MGYILLQVYFQLERPCFQRGQKSFHSYLDQNAFLEILSGKCPNYCQNLLAKYRILGHSSSRHQTKIQGKYHSCPGHILNCQHSQHQSRNLLPLSHIVWSLCSNRLLHFHQHIQNPLKIVRLV